MPLWLLHKAWGAAESTKSDLLHLVMHNMDYPRSCFIVLCVFEADFICLRTNVVTTKSARTMCNNVHNEDEVATCEQGRNGHALYRMFKYASKDMYSESVVRLKVSDK